MPSDAGRPIPGRCRHHGQQVRDRGQEQRLQGRPREAQVDMLPCHFQRVGPWPASSQGGFGEAGLEEVKRALRSLAWASRSATRLRRAQRGALGQPTLASTSCTGSSRSRACMSVYRPSTGGRNALAASAWRGPGVSWPSPTCCVPAARLSCTSAIYEVSAATSSRPSRRNSGRATTAPNGVPSTSASHHSTPQPPML